jgi:hypothetical protein
MPRTQSSVNDPTLLNAALEGLELQRQRLDDQIRQVRGMLGTRRGRPPASAAHNGAEAPRPRRTLSLAARKRIAQAQKRRWAAYRKRTGG